MLNVFDIVISWKIYNVCIIMIFFVNGPYFFGFNLSYILAGIFSFLKYTIAMSPSKTFSLLLLSATALYLALDFSNPVRTYF